MIRSDLSRSYVFVILTVIFSLIFLSAPSCGYLPKNLKVRKSNDSINLTNRDLKVEFTRNPDGKYIMKTFIRYGDWIPMFDSGAPLIQGKHFNNLPDKAKVISNSQDKAAIELTGYNDEFDYSYKITVEAYSDSPLIHFRIDHDLKTSILVDKDEPSMLLWMERSPNDLVSIHQEVPSYQWIGDQQWNSCFPAAYVWTDQLESGIFYNIEAMDWFSFKQGVERFRNMQVKVTAENNRISMGFDIRNDIPYGKRIQAGTMTVDFWLMGGAREQKPTKLDSLGIIVDAFGECFPSSTVQVMDQIAKDGSLTYRRLVEKTAEQLMLEDITYKISPYYKVLQSKEGVWTDGPAFSEQEIRLLIRRPSYAVGGALDPAKDGIYDVINSGNWNTNNNTLIPWIGIERLHPDPKQKEMIDIGYAGLKTYYDPVSRLIRSFEAADNYRGGGVEFSFQNFHMAIETLQAFKYRGLDEFDPAVAGKFIQGLDGTMEITRVNKYIIPQLYYGGSKKASVSLDEPALDVTLDVWTLAVYAYEMCMAYDFTGDPKYLEEAKKSTEYLFTGISFSVSNSVFDAVYDDPYDFPMNDVASSAWGVAASQYLYKVTGEEKYLKYSEYYRNITLRLMVWFESDLRDDPKDSFLRSAGMMHVSPAAGTPCPWETMYSYLPLLMELKNPDIEVSPLLLKMFDQFRYNNLFFSGAAWDPSVFPSAKFYQEHPASYLMSEDFYQAETPTVPGTWGPCVYMSNNPFYAYLMYEAFLSSSDPSIMTLDLDLIDQVSEMIEGVQRNFLVYNPTDNKSDTILRFHFLKGCDYLISVTSPDKKVTKRSLSASDLESGYPIRLNPGEYVRINITVDDPDRLQQYTEAKLAQSKISILYAEIQSTAVTTTDSLQAMIEQFNKALSYYNSEDYTLAASTAEKGAGK